MRHYTITIRTQGVRRKIDVIAASTMDAIASVRAIIPHGCTFSISGRPA